ncbi:MAG: hypothetical protein JOY64_26410 [Alphaproteobacteria bacterium]|nr:hypothetical protein [Alphaproteobacteria bacterium]
MSRQPLHGSRFIELAEEIGADADEEAVEAGPFDDAVRECQAIALDITRVGAHQAK